jgi:hypothetical protein
MRVAYDKLLPALQEQLSSERLNGLGRTVGFIRRLRDIRASFFVWATVLSRFGSGRPGFEQARQWYRRLTRVELWPRPFQMRFKSERAVALFAEAFEAAVAPWRGASRRRPKHVLARRFADIVAWDSSWVQLADVLRKHFKGTHGMKAALKVVLGISVFGLLPVAAKLVAANIHDAAATMFPALSRFAQGTLFLFDKGFVAYDRLRSVTDASMFYLCPMRLDGNAQIVGVHRAPAKVRKALRAHPRGVMLRSLVPKNHPIRQPWDLEVLVRPKHGPDRRLVRTRLVIVPGPHRRQHPYLTNLDPLQWPPSIVRELYRLRWQVELVFKELKQHLNLDVLPTTDRFAVQILMWASLIALALSRMVSGWLWPFHRLVGLASAIRPQLVTRALRASIRTLGRALVAAPPLALDLSRMLAEDLRDEVRALSPMREDSLHRIEHMLTDGAAA